MVEAVVAGKYAYGKHKIGNGSFGIIYEGRNLDSPFEKVAIKMEENSKPCSLRNECNFLRHL
jgi:hypothetical protein